MANEFGKLTINPNNAAQIDALKKIADPSFGINGSRILKTGNDLSIFQGDIEKFKESNLSKVYNEEQMQTLFNVMDADGSGKLDANEITSLAEMGKDTYDCIPDDKTSIDENDMAALYEMAQAYVDDALNDDNGGATTTTPSGTTKPTTDNTGNSTTTTVTTTTVTTTTVTNGTTTTGTPNTSNVNNNTNINNNTNVSNNTTINNDTKVEEEKPQTLADRTSISDNDALMLCDQLHDALAGLGTNQDTLKQIITSGQFNSADLVKLQDVYKERYGESLTHDINGEWGMQINGDNKQYISALYAATSEEARNALGWNDTDDIPKDIAAMAIDVSNSIKGGRMNPITATKFAALPKSMQAQVLTATEMLYPNESSTDKMQSLKVMPNYTALFLGPSVLALNDAAHNNVVESAFAIQRSAIN